MLGRALRLLLIGCLSVGALWAANSDPFLGEWKVNPSKCKLTDQMKVESVAGNKYTLDVGGGAETIVIDGTDQPGYGGTTLSISIEGPGSWKVVRKQEGRILLTASWRLSADGKTLTDDFTQLGPNGSSTNVKFLYNRTAGTSGFAGTWESSSATLSSPYAIKIEPYEGYGLSFINSSQGSTRNVTFDGKAHPLEGPNAPAGATSSAQRLNERTLEITTRINDKVASTQEDKLSSDGKTLTMTIHAAGRNAPNILVFERQ